MSLSYFRMRLALYWLGAAVVVWPTGYFGTRGVRAEWGDTAAWVSNPFWFFVCWCICTWFVRRAQRFAAAAMSDDAAREAA
jgi:type VI protein secretion system component VasK